MQENKGKDVAPPMTSRQRMITAFWNRQPDRVPVSPDISNMVPARRTGKPFWEIYLHNDPPIGYAYVDAVRYYGFDGWSDVGGLGWEPGEVQYSQRIVEQSDEQLVVELVARTPAGDLRRVTVYPKDNPPWTTEKWIKDIERDLPKMKYLYPDPSNWSLDPYFNLRARMGESGVVGMGACNIPGVHDFLMNFEGGAEAVIFAYYDHHKELLELRDTVHEWMVRYVQRGLQANPDFVLLGASGLLSMQSPELVRELSLPTIQEITRLCKEAQVPSHLHACGKERFLVELFANESDLNSIEPLEMAPMGDCDLAQIKRDFGHRMALKGNLHTTDTMLRGTPKDVRREALRAMIAAAEGGGFVLATGDQCGRDTPDENLFALIETAREFGRYPLDYDAMHAELERLQSKS